MSLTPESLVQCLSQTYSPDRTLRQQSESALKNLANVPGATPLLLQVSCNRSQVDTAVRQAAAIQLKNLVKARYTARDGPVLRGTQDAEVLKRDLVSAIVSEPHSSVRDLLVEAVSAIATADFPEAWPALLPELVANVTQGSAASDALRVHNVMLIIRRVMKRYEYKPKESRQPLEDIVSAVFPLIHPLLSNLISSGGDSPDAGNMIKQTLKIFWAGTQFYLPNVNVPTFLGPWFEMLHSLATRPVPKEGQPADESERSTFVWWKVKKWTLKIMARVYSRYGCPKNVEAEGKAFALHFAQSIAPNFLAPVCELLALRSRGEYCTDRVVLTCLNYITTAVEQSHTYKLLKPHIPFLLYTVCFPVICLTPADVKLFDEEPHEFIYKQNEFMMDYIDPSVAAASLISDLVKHRTKAVADQLIQFLVDILNRYPGCAKTMEDHVKLDGAFVVLGTQDEFLKKSPVYAPALPGLVAQHIIPLFSSPVGFLRSRAFWLVTRFCDIALQPETVQQLMEKTLTHLSDPALPVQIEASKALRTIITVIPRAEDTLRPVLPKILEEMFRIMNVIGNDEVVSALDIIIERFGSEIEPHAVALVQNLTMSFMKYVATYNEAEDESGESENAATAATQCLEAIATVLRAVAERPDIFRQVEPHIVTICSRVMNAEGDLIEYLENALDLITFVTFYQEAPFSAQVWSLFPLLFTTFHDYAFDYLPQMIGPLDNFITKDIKQFCAGVDANGVRHMDNVIQVVQKVLKENAEARGMESECRKALSLFLCVFQKAKMEPSVMPFTDNYLATVNDITLAKLNHQSECDISATRIQCYTVIGSLLWYNVEKEFAELERRGVVSAIMTMWIKDYEDLDKWMSKKATVLGWLAFLTLGSDRLQRNGVDVTLLVRGVIEICSSLRDDSAAKGDDDSDGEDDIDGADPAFPQNQIAAASAFADAPDDEEDGDVDFYGDHPFTNPNIGQDAWLFGGGGWDEDDEDYGEYETPLDDVKEVIILEEVLNGFMAREPEVFAGVKSALPQETVQKCGVLFAEAASQRAELASKGA